MYSNIKEMPIFKNLFPNYETFKNWYLSTPLSDDTTDVPSEKTFTLIAYEYNVSHCAMQEEDFKQHFAIDIYTFYKEFEATTKSISDLMNLTDDEIAIADQMITNYANTPETASSTDTTSIDFISNQQKVINEKGKLQVKKEQLSSKRVFTVRQFLKRFKHLFMVVLDTPYTPVIMESQED